MNRAYAVLEIKSVDEEKRTFRGIATTPSTDRMGDIVEPKGAVFKLPLPLLWQHNPGDPIGWVHTAKITSAGIEVEGEIANIPEEGELKNRLQKAWQMLKNKLVRGLSIGFNSIESSRIENTYSYHFLKWEWLELSAVTIPANQEATITAIKSICAESQPASRQKGGPVRLISAPGDSGQARKSIKLVRSNDK
jgi:HK97 family phage prohead protease